MKKELLIVLGIVLLSIGIILILKWNVEGVNSTPNGFLRKEYIPILKEINEVTHNGEILYYCGETNSQYFFSGLTSGKLTSWSKDFKTKNVIYLKLDTNRFDISSFQIEVDSPHICILATRSRCILNFDSLVGPADVTATPLNFAEGIQISRNAYILKGDDSSLFNKIFLKILIPAMSIKYEHNISEKINDLGLGTDGHMIYDRENGNIYYMHFYDNKLSCFDTDLHLIHVFKTLDTVSKNPNRAMVFSNSSTKFKSASFTAPPRFVNWWGDVDGHNLYIYSNLKADNENGDLFNENSVIDVFQLPGGNYQYSFYVPLVDGKKMVNFKISKKKLLAFYTDKLIVYLLAQE